MILRLSLDLPEDEEYVRTTRLLSRALLEDLRVVPGDVDDVEVIVNELCANVLRHARSARARYEVLLEYHREKVVVTVRDGGGGFSPDAVPPPGALATAGGGGRPAGDVRVGGFGLPLLRELSDRLEFTPVDDGTGTAGTAARAEKGLHYRTPAAEARAEHMDQTEAGEVDVTG